MLSMVTWSSDSLETYGDESDLDRNIDRLCEYLSGSEEEEVDGLPSVKIRTNPSSELTTLRMGQNQTKRYSYTRPVPIDTSMAWAKRVNGLQYSDQMTMNHNGMLLPEQVLHFARAPMLPNSNAALVQVPLPPKRPLPPLPDECAYEEARSSCSDRAMANNNSIGHLTTGRAHKLPEPPDWPCKYEPLALECGDNVNFLIPSSRTNSTGMSPSVRSEAQHAKNNYLLSPTMVSGRSPFSPVPAISARAMTLPYASGSGFVDLKSAKQQKLMELCCSWKSLTYMLASALIFSLAVICYLLVVVTGGQAHVQTPAVQVFETRNGGGNPSLSNVEYEPIRPFPENVALGDVVIADLAPNVMTIGEFLLPHDSHVQFNTSVSPQTKLAFFLRQTLPPSITQYDFHQIIMGAKLHAQPSKRSALQHYGYPVHLQSTRLMSFVHLLTAGQWFVGLLNDDNKYSTVKFSVSPSDAAKEKCKYSCFEKGICSNGRCVCFDGFAGEHCEKSICPAVCSGNGLFSGGKCHCHRGWKGGNCDLPYNVCEVPDCNGHGQCGREGRCHCNPGYGGEFCDQPACPIADCSGHGVCTQGQCYCQSGWRGEGCDEPDTAEQICSTVSMCSKHGEFDSATASCVCQKGWTGKSCEHRVCSLECGVHGTCVDQQCQCQRGWTGADCSSLACLPGCEEHGTCQNGTCSCHFGWQGANCQIAGCPNNCTGHGLCQKDAFGNWQCSCDSNYAGHDCHLQLETQCSDGVDNDNDGLTDCEDSECCITSDRCAGDSLCQTVIDPSKALLRQQTSPRHASFYQKSKFILEQDSVQLYADVKLFNESRSSVIRGRVLNENGGALTGVRVTDTSNALYGFTLSRNDGWFDLLVNGGGSVTLQLMRLPFGSTYRTYPVRWNVILNVGDIVLSKESSLPRTISLDEHCKRIHINNKLRPLLRPGWKGSGEKTTQSFVDTGVVEESITISGTDVRLVYLSANSASYKSLLSMHLLPSTLPEDIRLVKLNVNVEGVQFEKTLSPVPSLNYTYQWDKLNAYRQKVYGLVVVRVSVGYLYAGCAQPVWFNEMVKMNGFQSSTSDIGGLNLNIHHHLDVNNGILERGDGSVTYLAESEPVVISKLGNGRQRPLDCANCNVEPKDVSFYLPAAIATGKDGSLFIGDHTLVRRWKPGGLVHTVLQLGAADVAHQYHLAVHPFSGDLYVALPSRRQIIRVLSSPMATDFAMTNYEIAVGSGEACFSGENCGDGGPAEIAKLNYPKGIAFDAYGNLFIADEVKIRLVTVDGLIKTLIDSSVEEETSKGNPSPSGCSLQYEDVDFRLVWPTELSYDAVKERLLFLDSDVLYEYFHELGLVRRLQGVPSHCSHFKSTKERRSVILRNVVSLSVSRLGFVAVSETDNKLLHRLRVFDANGATVRNVGSDRSCSCDHKNCPCDEQPIEPASLSRLSKPVALAYGEDDALYIVDQGTLKVRALQASVPKMVDQAYRIQSKTSDETFTFNQFGQHVATEQSTTGQRVFNFSYHLDTSYGKLIEVTSVKGQQLFISRKKQNGVVIELSSGGRLKISVNPLNRMADTVSGDHPLGTLQFVYFDNTSLLKNLTDSSGRQRLFDYDTSGRLLSAKMAASASPNALHQR